jgi:hypothetical protein
MMSIFAVENIVNSALKIMNRVKTNQAVCVHIVVRSAIALDAIETI